MTFSVVIPAYNAEMYIAGAVRSARLAGSEDIIVVDDGSTDETVDAARSTGAHVVTQRNAGAAAARIRGAELAAHPLVIFLDADDELIASGVRRSLLLMANRPDAVAVGGLVVGLRPDGSRCLLERSPDRDLSFPGLLHAGFGPWPPAAAVVRGSAFARALRIDPARLATRYAEDYELVLRLALTGPVLSHQEPSAVYRMHVGKASSNSVAPLAAKEDIRRYYADHHGVPISVMGARELRAASWMRRARYEHAHRRRAGAICCAAVAVAARPVYSLQKVVWSAVSR